MSRCIFIFLFLLSTPIHSGLPTAFVVWNVGQGSWSTLFWREKCWHFDMGGEFFPQQISTWCRQRENYLFLSHDDWDHISFIARLKRWPRFCLFQAPRRSSKGSRKKLLENIKACPSNQMVAEIPFSPEGSTPNDLSRIYWLPSLKILIPGDSPQNQERQWARLLPRNQVKWWLLGHHGSQTSSSKFLIKKISKAQGAIASARHKRYGHPHPKVVGRVRNSGIPVIKTEDWGNIWISLKETP